MVLALAVFNRLFIYISFNGMTRMRIVALYGMSAVAVGFVLVVWKIVAQAIANASSIRAKHRPVVENRFK